MKITNRVTLWSDEKSALSKHKCQRRHGIVTAKSVIFLVMFVIIFTASYHILKPQSMALGNGSIVSVRNTKIDSLDRDTRQANIRLLQNLRMKNVRRGQSVLSAATPLKVNLKENVCVRLPTLKQAKNDWRPNTETRLISHVVSSAVEVERNTHIEDSNDAERYISPFYGW